MVLTMRDLDAINHSTPRSLLATSAVAPMFMGLVIMAVIDDRPYDRSFDDPAMQFAAGMVGAGIVMLALAFVYRWTWQTRHIGVAFLNLLVLSSTSLVPALWISIDSGLSAPWRALLAQVVVAAHLLYGRRTLQDCRKIAADDTLFGLLYQEDEEAVYFLRKVQARFREQLFQEKKVARSRLDIGLSAAAVALAVVLATLADIQDLPAVPILGAIGCLPLSVWILCVVLRGWMFHVWYPLQIRRRTGKHVYLDQGTWPRDYGERMQQRERQARRHARTGRPAAAKR